LKDFRCVLLTCMMSVLKYLLKSNVIFVLSKDSGENKIVMDDWIVFASSDRVARLVMVIISRVLLLCKNYWVSLPCFIAFLSQMIYLVLAETEKYQVHHILLVLSARSCMPTCLKVELEVVAACVMWQSDRTFGFVEPWVWNNLSTDLRQPHLLLSWFRQLLKTFLFEQWDHSALWTVLNCTRLKYP